MRFYFPNNSRPKKAAKFIASATHRKLSDCQKSVAIACGYSDWHEMEGCYNRKNISLLDEKLDSESYVKRQNNIANRIVRSLELSSIDAQYVLAGSQLTGNRIPTTLEILTIVCSLLRSNEIPHTANRKIGAVGKLKSPRRNGEQVILKQFGQPTRVITHKTGNATVADFEYISPKKALDIFVPMRVYLPFGVWTENDGSKVLFSRDYCPMWRLSSGKKPERVLPWQRIDFTKKEYYWHTIPPWEDNDIENDMRVLMESFELIGLPYLANTFPITLSVNQEIDFADTGGIFQFTGDRDALSILKRHHEHIVAC